jgi:hypothetical protein
MRLRPAPRRLGGRTRLEPQQRRGSRELVGERRVVDERHVEEAGGEFAVALGPVARRTQPPRP